jgi:hypothetical protein
LKFKALILAFVFLFGGSGLSIDIAKCCDHISGVSLSLKSKDDAKQDDCCSKIKPVSKKSCCSEQLIQMVINPVLGLQKTVVHVFKTFEAKLDRRSELCIFAPIPVELHKSAFESFDHCYPIPVLLRKRVLQI